MSQKIEGALSSETSAPVAENQVPASTNTEAKVSRTICYRNKEGQLCISVTDKDMADILKEAFDHE
jgi:hypothetical protein